MPCVCCSSSLTAIRSTLSISGGGFAAHRRSFVPSAAVSSGTSRHAMLAVPTATTSLGGGGSSSSSCVRRLNAGTSSITSGQGSLVVGGSLVDGLAAGSTSSSIIHGQIRASHGSQPSAVRGIITPYRGFVTTDIRIDNNTHIGGQYSRGVFASANIGYGREIMNIRPIASYVGDEPIRDQAMIIATDLFATLVNFEKNPAAEAFILSRVMSMMNGGRAFFLRERDVTTFIDRVPGGSRYMEMGKVSVMQLQKLPQQVEFNRWEVEYRGRKGICVFPEASYFNHQCAPNVEVTIMHDSIKGFSLSAIAIKPIKAGEELFINYMPDNDLPLSRLQLALRNRWGFDCSCIICRARSTASYVLALTFVLVPGILYLRSYHQEHQENKMRRATGS